MGNAGNPDSDQPDYHWYVKTKGDKFKNRDSTSSLPDWFKCQDAVYNIQQNELFIIKTITATKMIKGQKKQDFYNFKKKKRRNKRLCSCVKDLWLNLLIL